MATSWLDGLTWWHVHPLGFSGAEADSAQVHNVVHRLRHLATWLDYATDLGCRGLRLGPIFASASDGHDTTDHLRIDHRLGDERDFDDLAAACRARGLRLLLDGSFAHVSVEHPMFQVARAAGPNPSGADAQAARWFRMSWPAGRTTASYEAFAGNPGLVMLDHSEPAIVDYVAHVMDHWLSRGADGWRLSAASAVPADFWREVVGRVRTNHPDAWFVGDYPDAEPKAVLERTGLDGVTADWLWAPLWQSLNDLDYSRLAARVEPLAALAGTHPPLTFVGSDEVTRLASALHDQRHFGHAIAAMFVLPGVPSVYYGDEQAFRGSTEERFGGAEAVRPMFPERADVLAPWGWPIFHLHRRLIELRSRHPWLTRSRTQVAFVSSTALALRATPAPDKGRALVALLNIADAPHRFEVALPEAVVEVQSDDAAGEPDLRLVPGHAWRILSHS